jgi:HEAT repeat protein
MKQNSAIAAAAFMAALCSSSPAYPAPPASPAPPAQVPFERAMEDLASPDAAIRLRTVHLLKEAAYLEAAVPLAKLVVDPQDEVQLAAIAAELNIFLAEKIVSRKRVGFIVEVRTPVAADAVFDSGPLAIGTQPVPTEVLDALRAASRDDNPRVRLEAVYAFGVLAVEPGGSRRREMLLTSGPDLAAMIGAVDPFHRYAALRVIGRVFERRPEDGPVDRYVGDAVVGALNDREKAMQSAAMQALGAMRYERGVQALMDLFQHYGGGGMAAEALDAVARIAHPSSLPLLASQLASKNAGLKGIAIEGLARTGDRARLADIQNVLTTERNEGLVLAGRFASAMLAGGTLDPIVAALARSRLRDRARWYLVEIAPGRTQAFTRFLQDPDPMVRVDLVNALGLSDDGAALELVQRMASDPDVQVARAVERALARLRQLGS